MMGSDAWPQHEYGLSAHVFAFPKPQGDAIVIGGLSGRRQRWTRVLSHRAAGMLWVALAQALEPERARTYLSELATFPMRELNKPTITTSVKVDPIDDVGYEICGTSGEQSWSAILNETEARAFWQALTRALRPTAGNPLDPARDQA